MAPMRVTARASWRYSGSAVNPPSCAALRPRPNRFSWEEFATKTAQPPRALAGSRAPPRFVMRSPLQFPRSAAAPPQRPRNADRSGSYANTVCGSTIAKSKPSFPHRRERLQDRSKQPRGSCRADQANLLRCYIAAKAATMPPPRAKPTSSLAVASPKMQKKRADEWRHLRFEIGGVANNVNVGKFR
jgi:hypothetical protein